MKCSERLPRPESGCGEHPHPPFHHPFSPPGRREQGHWPPKKHHHPMGVAPHDFCFYLDLVDELFLSEEQVKQIQSIASECEKSRIMSVARMKVGEVELQELLNQPELDLGKVDAKIREIGEIKIESHINDVHAMIDARAVLTQEQKEKLKRLRPIPCNGRF